MTADETHEDFADVETYGFVCTDPKCWRYRKEVEVVVFPGTYDPVDTRDLDCDCGAGLIPTDVAEYAEQIEPETIRRYQEVGV